MSAFGRRYGAFDRFQQRHRWLGFPLAVLPKYADDQDGRINPLYHHYQLNYTHPTQNGGGRRLARR